MSYKFYENTFSQFPKECVTHYMQIVHRSHLDYGEILYDKRENENFQNKLEKGQYRACIATTGAMQGTSSQKLYNKLGLHSLRKRRWPSKQIFCIKY